VKYVGEATEAGNNTPVPETDPHVGTRNKVVRLILEAGPSTAADLAEKLDLTTAGVRRHLDALIADGIVDAREQRVYGHRGRGRPAKVFALTDTGRDAFDQEYDSLAVDALGFLEETLGEDAVLAFARKRVAEVEQKYRSVVDAAPAGEKAQALARALSADGYAATARQAPGGEQLCQHHCPVAHVAERFPQLCEAETEVFARLLGTHVQRLATIAHGDGVCTTHVPNVKQKEATPAAPAVTRKPDASPAVDTDPTPASGRNKA
jgi:predicted ArsR family transcriptional regulator